MAPERSRLKSQLIVPPLLGGEPRPFRGDPHLCYLSPRDEIQGPSGSKEASESALWSSKKIL